METHEIEETLSRTRLRPPKTVFILSSPIIAPQLKAVVFGLNPRFERSTIVLASNATEETVVHETLHTLGLGELLTYPLAKIITRFRTVFPASRRREIKYQERLLSSEELKKYGLASYRERNGYVPTQLTVKQLSLVES